MKTTFLFLACLFFGVSSAQKQQIETLLNNWHQAAAEAKFDTYFSYMSQDAIYIGTDATENWQLDAFKAFAKPYFDQGKAWDFKAVERNIFFSDDKSIAWFDELLTTQMKLCRGSGVLKKENGKWKIAHYVLSMAIPNENIEQVIALKAKFDDDYLEKAAKKNAASKSK